MVTGFICLAVLGLTLVVWGLLGRRVDDHPVCRRCRFDLIGRATSAGPCPECGSTLTGRRSIRIGNRQRRRLPVAMGIAALALDAVASGVVLASVWRGSSLVTYMPQWLLLIQAQASNAAPADAALKELGDRFENDRLLGQFGATLVDKALVAQASKRPWRTGWGDILESAHSKGQLTPEQYAQYIRGIVSPAPLVRARVRAGDPVPLGLNFSTFRMGSASNYMLYAQLEDARIGKDELFENDRSGGFGGMDSWVMLSGSWSLPNGMAVRQLRRHRSRPGPATLTMRWHMRIMPPNAGGMTYSSRARQGKDPNALAEWDEQFESQLLITPADQDTVELINDAAVAEQLRQSAQVTMQGHRYSGQGMRILVPNVWFKDPPLDLAYTVSVRQGKHEWPDHPMTTSKLTGMTGWSNEPVSGLAEDEPVDIIVRPDPDGARETIDLFRIFGGELVFPGLPVQWQDVNIGAPTTAAVTVSAEPADEEPFVPEPPPPAPVFPDQWAALDETTHDGTEIEIRLAELAALVKNESIPPEDRDALLALALAVQADTSRPWHAEWGNIIESAWKHGLLSDEQRRSFARHALASALAVRSRVRVGDCLPAIIRIESRVGSTGLLSYHLDGIGTTLGPQSFSDGTTAMSGGLQIDDRSPLAGISVLNVTNRRPAGPFGGLAGSAVQAPPGTHAFRTRWKATVSEGQFDPQSRDPGAAPDPASIVSQWTLDLMQPVEVLAEGVEVIERIKDDSMADAIRRCIKVSACEGIKSTHEVRAWFTLKRTPMDVAFDVFIRSGDQEWAAPNAATSETLDPWWSSGYISVRGVPSDVQRVDLVFRASPANALSTVKITRIWDGEVVVPGILVKWRSSDR